MSAIKPVAGAGGGSGGGGVPSDGSVTNVKVASNAAISADKLVDGSANRILTAAERTKLTALPTSPVDPTIVNAKGDIIAATADNIVARFGVGANGQALIADSSQTTGLRWAAVAGTDPTNALSGAVGDGTTDNSTVFSSAASSVASTRGTVSGINRATKVINIPPGVYRVTSGNALMADFGIPQSQGYVVRGAGSSTTTILFDPPTANQYLFTNNDDWLVNTFEDINFHSLNSTASWMKSVSTGSAQNYSFKRVAWGGTWKYGIDLQGTDTNSEMCWVNCGVSGFWNTFLYAGPTGTSDQFVNYNFFGCNCEVDSGNFIDMAMGGNVSVYGGSLIHLGNATPTTSSPQCFFRFRGGDHASGVGRLKVVGTRIEHRHTASQLANIEWKHGAISFDNLDTDATATLDATQAASLIQCEFGAAGSEIPGISFRDCILLGKHKYSYDDGSWQYRKSIRYDNCSMVSYPTAAGFITTNNLDAGGNIGGTPPIHFNGCRGNDDAEWYDTVVNWRTCSRGYVNAKHASLKLPWGELPVSAGTMGCLLPPNAMIIRVRAGKPSGGSSTSTNFAYTLRNASNVVVATAAGNGSTAWNAGFNYDSGALNYFCDTDLRRNLTVTATNIAEGTSTGYFIIDYIG